MSSLGTIRLKFIRSDEDGPPYSREYQIGLRHFYDQVRTEGLRISAVSFTMDRAGGHGGFMGEFVIPLAQVIGPVLGDNALAWLQARSGRLMKIKVGSVEFEASTQADLDRLLAQAQALRDGSLKMVSEDDD